MLTKSGRTLEIPAVIGLRTDDLKPLLAKWRKKNPRASWAFLLREGLCKELSPLAGKRYGHLVRAAK